MAGSTTESSHEVILRISEILIALNSMEDLICMPNTSALFRYDFEPRFILNSDMGLISITDRESIYNCSEILNIDEILYIKNNILSDIKDKIQPVSSFVYERLLRDNKC